MALKGFFDKNELSETDVKKVFQQSVHERAPAFLSTATFFYEGDIIAYVEDTFYLSNSLSREEALSHFRGRALGLKVAQGGTLFQGETKLTGLGRYRNVNILKLQVPESLKNKDPRGAYRLRTFAETPYISFSFKDSNIGKGKILDISMSGVAFRPDGLYKISDMDLQLGSNITIDIRLEDTWKISTFAVIRHVTHNKVGVEYTVLSEIHKANLFKFIVKMRKVEVQKRLLMQERIQEKNDEKQEQGDTPQAKASKPRVLIFHLDDPSLAEFLEKVLQRRFDVVLQRMVFSEIRDDINEAEPDLILMEMTVRASDEVSRRKKIAAAMIGHVPYMLYGEDFSPEFVMTHFNTEPTRKLLLDLTGRSTIISYKKIETFFGRK